MFIGSIQTIIIAVTLPRRVNTMFILTSELALIAIPLLNAAKFFAFILPASACHIAVAKPNLWNTLVFRLCQMRVRRAMELLIRTCAITTAMNSALVGTIAAIVFAVAYKGSAYALAVVTLE